MLLGYILQIVISVFFSYIIFHFFKKKLRYSLILIFINIFLLNLMLGILGNIIVIVYIFFGILFKFHSKKPKIEKFLNNLTMVILIAFTALIIIDLILKIVSNKDQFTILIKLSATIFWSSLLLMFFELKKHFLQSNT